MLETVITSNGKNVRLRQLLMLVQPCPQTFIQVICVFPRCGLLTLEGLCLSQGECPWGTMGLCRSGGKDQCWADLRPRVENDTQGDQR